MARNTEPYRVRRARPTDGSPTVGQRWIEGFGGKFGAFNLTGMGFFIVCVMFTVPVLMILLDLTVGGSYVYYMLQDTRGSVGKSGVALCALVTFFTTALSFFASWMLRNIWMNLRADRADRKQRKMNSSEPEVRLSFVERIGEGFSTFGRVAAASGTSAVLAVVIILMFAIDTVLDLGGVTAYLLGPEYVQDIIPPPSARSTSFNLLTLLAMLSFTAAEPVFHVLIHIHRPVIRWMSDRLDTLWYDDAEISEVKPVSIAIEHDAPPLSGEQNGRMPYPSGVPAG